MKTTILLSLISLKSNLLFFKTTFALSSQLAVLTCRKELMSTLVALAVDVTVAVALKEVVFGAM